MKYRIFGKTGERVSVLGFGCMRLPVLGGDKGKVDVDVATRMIRYAVDHGLNYIDTAYTYHEGNNEAAVAKALQGGYRHKVFIATKLPIWNVEKRDDMEKLLDAQLRNLQTDTIDFYLVHSLNAKYWSKLVRCGLFDFLHKAKEKGKVRHVGFSFHDSYELFVEIVDSFPWEFCQIQYNYLDERFQAGTKGLKYAHSKGLGIAVMEPLKGGTLVNNLIPEAKALIDQAVHPIHPAELGLRWVWSHPEVAVALSGMNEMSQVVDNIRFAEESEKPLSAEEKELIAQIQKLYRRQSLVNCTGCKYCMPCPNDVDIPQCFEYYNKALAHDDEGEEKRSYERMSSAANCVECGTCETRCPQSIKIIETLKKVRDLCQTADFSVRSHDGR